MTKKLKVNILLKSFKNIQLFIDYIAPKYRDKKNIFADQNVENEKIYTSQKIKEGCLDQF